MKNRFFVCMLLIFSLALIAFGPSIGFSTPCPDPPPLGCTEQFVEGYISSSQTPRYTFPLTYLCPTYLWEAPCYGSKQIYDYEYVSDNTCIKDSQQKEVVCGNVLIDCIGCPRGTLVIPLKASVQTGVYCVGVKALQFYP